MSYNYKTFLYEEARNPYNKVVGGGPKTNFLLRVNIM